MASDADVVAYMDVDLSTDLSALMPLVAPLISGHSDVAIGSRLAASSRVVRGPKREFVSRSYNLILRSALGARFSDAQCGFKAVRADVARQLLPLVADTGWFFDTELLVIAERAGLRIHEVPVDWVDDPDSRVDIVDTAINDLKGCWRVGRALATGALPVRELQRSLGREPLVPGVPPGMVGQLVRFGMVGVASTLAYALLYLVLHPAMGAQAANLTALLLTAVGNTAANRAFTFGIRGRARRGAPPTPWAAGLRVRAGHHERIAVRPAPLRPDGRQGGGAVGVGGGQPRCDRGPIRRAAVGLRLSGHDKGAAPLRERHRGVDQVGAHHLLASRGETGSQTNAGTVPDARPSESRQPGPNSVRTVVNPSVGTGQREDPLRVPDHHGVRVHPVAGQRGLVGPDGQRPERGRHSKAPHDLVHRWPAATLARRRRAAAPGSDASSRRTPRPPPAPPPTSTASRGSPT